MGAKPSEAIFIDDLKRNVIGARKVGIKSIQFIGYEDLVKHLKVLGIKW
jgi:FMN phosphatase YigB (HAD superfamily)